jgi:hypothetical protein
MTGVTLDLSTVESATRAKALEQTINDLKRF